MPKNYSAWPPNWPQHQIYPGKPVYNFLEQTVSNYVKDAKTEQQEDDALELTRKVIVDMNPSTAVEYAMRARLYVLLEDNEKVLGDYSRSIELEPEDANLYLARAELFRGSGETDKALADYDKAAELRPDLEWVYRDRGEVYLTTQEYEKALADFSKSIQLAPETWWLYKRRAEAHFNLGHYDEALADITRAVDRNPNDTSNLTWIPPSQVAVCPDKALRKGLLELADRTVELTDHSAGAYATRGVIHWAFG